MMVRTGLRASTPVIKIENRLCWFCEHFHFWNAEPDYSEVTPGSDFSMYCDKQHWEFSPYHTSQTEFGKMLTTARECPDFVPVKEIDGLSR